MLHVVLVNPQIPPNTGNIARLCAAMNYPLHLVKPLGFSTDDRALKRAGLDYWPYVTVFYHENLESLQEKYKAHTFYYFTTKAKKSYWDVTYKDGDFLVFGSETKGLDESVLEANKETALTIPMPQKGKVRSLNLSTAVGMVVGEATRQVETRFITSPNPR